MHKIAFLFIIATMALISCKSDQEATTSDATLIAALTPQPVEIDGIIDRMWEAAPWHPIDQVWLGSNLAAQDFSGQYKLLYDENYLYVLANITDDRLIDEWEDGLKNYWDDDCLEIFIDEDRSKGNHQYSHNAFAYHIALDGRVADIGPDSLPHYYTDHIKSARKSAGMRHIWEAAIKIYDDSYQDEGNNTPVKLANGKRMGFAIAYCDNDNSREREHFIGSTVVEGEDKNRGWIDAGIFEELRLD